MATIASKVKDRLSSEKSNEQLDKASIVRAVELSDRFSSVTPQEYILPLTLLSGGPRSQSLSGIKLAKIAS